MKASEYVAQILLDVESIADRLQLMTVTDGALPFDPLSKQPFGIEPRDTSYNDLAGEIIEEVASSLDDVVVKLQQAVGVCFFIETGA